MIMIHNKRERKSPKRIVFNISEEDHEKIKKIAASKRISMTMWIINALALAIKIDETSNDIAILLKDETH